MGGGPSFFVALTFIGIITFIVGEFATVLGCALGIEESVSAITLVALGTSLPDTFASIAAANGSPNADAAVGNITGSNAVNVFLGLGIPWGIATIYHQSTFGKPYYVKAGPLAFSVVVFLCCAVICFIVLIIRRRVRTFYYFYLNLFLMLVNRRRARRLKIRKMVKWMFPVHFMVHIHINVYFASIQSNLKSYYAKILMK